MATNALVQTRIDAATKARATEVLAALGLTVSDAVRILLTRTANEGALPMELVIDREAYDIWFRERIAEALDDDRPDVADETVRTRFAARRAAALANKGDA